MRLFATLVRQQALSWVSSGGEDPRKGLLAHEPARRCPGEPFTCKEEEKMKERKTGSSAMQRRSDDRPPRALTEPPTEPWEYGSVVSYPERYKFWGDGRFRGNCDGRLFVRLVEQYRPRSAADPMVGSGTTRDAARWLRDQGALAAAVLGS